MPKKLCVVASFIIITSLCPSAAKAATTSKETTPKNPYNWSGFYLGANFGGAFGNANPETTTSANDPSTAYFNVASDVRQVEEQGADRLKPHGLMSGGQAGYNYQRKRFVLGLETDFDYFNLNRSQSGSERYESLPASRFTIRHHVSTNWLYTLRPRIGYSIGRWLIYGTGGMAVSKIKFNGEFEDDNGGLNQTNASASKTRLGWNLGAGLEYGITQHWSIKSEYLYVNFRNFSVESTLSALGAQSLLNHEVALEAHIIRIGINYKF